MLNPALFSMNEPEADENKKCQNVNHRPQKIIPLLNYITFHMLLSFFRNNKGILLYL